MTIREAVDTIVTHGRPARHSERAQGCVAVDRTFAKASVRLRRKSGVGQTPARRIGGIAHP
jgi:hypothetical protein